MGAFAMTATQALLASGGPPRGYLWWHYRKTYAAMLEETDGAQPIMVIDRETVALPLLLPRLDNQQQRKAMANWLSGHAWHRLALRLRLPDRSHRELDPAVFRLDFRLAARDRPGVPNAPGSAVRAGRGRAGHRVIMCRLATANCHIRFALGAGCFHTSDIWLMEK
jgi:hypothetical protein